MIHDDQDVRRIGAERCPICGQPADGEHAACEAAEAGQQDEGEIQAGGWTW